ncbi:ribosome assembly RNA-binding protein YhbY [Pleionea litopenaei]|uniref:Ribosome assembly RNA-binding protein YhbY n=1 Tax=Pleionea litopenaei TaxID=3070815 RepID=A0AA51RS37_9GAMM|nr:ribosome assembly RNA-binding protein YhbY [Pleionea sp. HL-JVS1]WMS86489.1 ribosome assembly RNA-binding protein YhbY [Pleionea sp. HL-JVS1]
MKLTTSQVRYLRSLAHSLKPVVMVGANGITEGLLDELSNALATHELIKVKVRAEEREERDEIIELLCRKSGAQNIQRVGHVLTLFKRNSDKPKINLPK